jgi:hypothetical protein
MPGLGGASLTIRRLGWVQRLQTQKLEGFWTAYDADGKPKA